MWSTLCSWLSGGNDPSVKPIWLDRFYNPSKLAFITALTGTSYSLAFDNLNNNVKNVYGDLGIYDKPSDLIFEVTETQVIGNIGEALAFLSRLRLHGFGLSIDDYGTGYSSVKQLSQIPFTELKMDRSLIEGVASKSHLQVIFESTLSMCNKLGIDLVAEGIEKHKDWEYLRSAGCHVAQGYYISPPMPSYEVVNWVHAGMPALHDKMA